MGSVLTILAIICMITLGSFSKVRKAMKEFDTAPQLQADPSVHRQVPEEQSDYFTYETLKNEPSPQQPLHQEVVIKEPQAADEATPFDLRQAVIYQTILKNDYIADLK